LLDRVMKDLARCIMLAAFVKGDSEWVASFTLLLRHYTSKKIRKIRS